MLSSSVKIALLCIVLVFATLSWLRTTYVEPKVGHFFSLLIYYAIILLVLLVIRAILTKHLSKSKHTHVPVVGDPFNIIHSGLLTSAQNPIKRN